MQARRAALAGILALLPLSAAGGSVCAQFAPPEAAPAPIVGVLGWSDAIDPQIMDAYAQETGQRIVYDTYDSEAGLEARLARDKKAFDLAIVPARLLPRLIAANQLQKLDRAVVASARDAWPDFAAKLAAFDPGSQYALVHMWFWYGLAYDIKLAAERLPEPQMASWDVLFRQENYKKFASCGMQLPDDADLMLPIALLAQRLAPDLRGPPDLKRAADLAARLRGGGAEFTASGAAGALADGEICLAVLPARDAELAMVRARANDPPHDIGFAMPKEGAPLALDVLVVLKDAPHVADAMRFAAYLSRPDIAARNSRFTHFANGVLASRALLPADERANRLAWPDDDTLKRLVLVPLPDPGLRKAIDREWLKVKTGSYEPEPGKASGKSSAKSPAKARNGDDKGTGPGARPQKSPLGKPGG